MSTVQINNSWWQLTIDPMRGGAVLEGRCYSSRDGEYRRVLGIKRSVAAGAATLAPLGQFLMLPFCNRIDQGKFTVDDQLVVFPLNRPDQSVAIHGISRDLPWRVIANGDNVAELEQVIDAGQTPYRYRAVLSYHLQEQAFTSTLQVTHLAAQALPYGLGFHPWFTVSDDANVTFTAQTYFDLDARGLPLDPQPCQPSLRFNRRDNRGMDRYFHGWNGSATITDKQWPGAIKITTGGALTNVHVFMSPVWPGVCVEPVSHAPDVHNRRHLARYGDCRNLACGESLSGEMRMHWIPHDERNPM